MNATVSTYVTEELTMFGPMNDGGVQVKIHKKYGIFTALLNAIKESPLTIGGRTVVVEEKKSNIRVRSTGNA